MIYNSIVLNSDVMIFFFNDTATTEIYTLSLHDALPILGTTTVLGRSAAGHRMTKSARVSSERHVTMLQRHVSLGGYSSRLRSEEHTSELQSQSNLVCRLLLEKKKTVECSVTIAPRWPIA